MAAVLIASCAASAADGGQGYPDVEEARVERARGALPEQVFATAPPTIACVDGAGEAGEASGVRLWRSSVAQVQADLEARGDDRPLYWRRLEALRDARRDCLHRESPLADFAPLLAFESASRGFTDVDYDARTDVRVLVTGFDPFLLDRNITQSNPSGVAALHLDGLHAAVGEHEVEIESVVVPVRFEDFDAGLVEERIVPLALRHGVDLLITISMGRDAFDLERFPGRRRSAEAPDNRDLRTGGSASTPVLPRLGSAPLAGPEFVEFTLPVDAMTAVDGPWAVRDNRSVTTLEDGSLEAASLAELDGRTAVRGGGGGYLSNEISYRVLNALRTVPEAPRSGHVHTPRIRGHDAETIASVVTQIEAMILAAAAEVAMP